MRYTKPTLTCDQQADQLLKRGMAGDRRIMINRLQSVSYYRLSGYWYPFRQRDPANPERILDTFRPCTTFSEVWNRYVFDRRLRRLVLDAIERIEIAVRAQLAYHHAHRHGAFGYATAPATLPACQGRRREDFLAVVKDETRRSKVPLSNTLTQDTVISISTGTRL